MNVRVRFFAWVRDATGTEECWISLAPGATGRDAKTLLVSRYQRLSGFLDRVRLALNQEYQTWEVPLRDGDELALIPPVSGG